MNPRKVYLDTCIVSGLAKEDLSVDDTSALLAILEAHKAGRLALVTSRLAHDEIAKIPEQHRARHTVIYSLLADVPMAETRVRTPPFKPTSFPHGVEQAPLLEKLEAILDKADAEHVYQAARNGVTYVITVDRKTMLARADAVQQLRGIRLVGPIEFQKSVD
jgi:predicted nucleic acid-binding protein